MDTTATENIKTPSVKTEVEKDGITLWAMWEGVDRKQGHGISVTKMAHASRLKRAIEAGAVFTEAQIKTDMNGQTYIDAKCNVRGRSLNSDLKKLGF